jgi:hypothetical protein
VSENEKRMKNIDDVEREEGSVNRKAIEPVWVVESEIERRGTERVVEVTRQ